MSVTIFRTQDGAETWESPEKLKSGEIKYFIVGPCSKDEALAAVFAESPAEYKNISRSEVRFDGVDDDGNYEISVVYSSSGNGSASGGDFSSTRPDIPSSFSCGGGTKLVTTAIKQTKLKGDHDPGLLVGWNGLTGSAMEVSGVEIPAAKLSETYTKSMKLRELSTSYKKRIAKLVGCVNKDSFKGYDPGEVMFIGMSYSGNGNNDDEEIDVTFEFQIQMNEDDVEVGDNLRVSKEGFEYIWVIPDRTGSEIASISSAFKATVCKKRDFSALGL